MSPLIIILLCFTILLLLNTSIAIAIGLGSTFYLVLADISIKAIPQRMFTTLDYTAFQAIPMFLLAGYLMNLTGFTDELFGFVRKLIGHLRGGLAYANVIASIIFAGMSGSAVADAVGLGLIEMKAMREAGYDEEFSACVTLASCTIGPIMPPSIVMIIYAVTANVSVGAMLLAGIVPALIMGSSLLVLIYILSNKKSYPRDVKATLGEIKKSFFKAILPLLTPVIIVGGITMGVVTPTEAAVLAVIYTLFVGIFVYNKVKIKDFFNVVLEVGITTSVIMFVIAASGIFGWILAREQIPLMITNAFLTITDNPIILMALINILLLFLGTILDATPIVLIMVPILLPLLEDIGVNLVHFGVIISVNVVIGLITPPIGVALYGVASISKTSVEKIIQRMPPFYIVLIVALIIITYFPKVTLFIPNFFGLIY